jgi:hypothetical protein
MLSELTEDQWKDLIKKQNINNLFMETDFTALISASFGGVPRYFYIENDSRFIAAFIGYETGRKLVLPIHYFYSGFAINHTLKDFHINDPLVEALNLLKKRYTRIQFKLPPEIQDIRAFKQCNFRYDTYYTYVKDLSNLDFNTNISRDIKKAEKYGVETVVDKDFHTSFDKHYYSLMKYGMGKKDADKTRIFLEKLKDTTYLNYITAFYEQKNSGSAFLLHYFPNAYLLMIDSDEEVAKIGVQTSIYNHFFNFYKEKGYTHLDLWGGNIPSIATFKSRWNTELRSYYIVEYSRIPLWDELLKYVKKFIKTIIG